MKLKFEPGARQGLGQMSQQPRASVRLDDGKFYNPFTKQQVNKLDGQHIPLNKRW